MKLDEHPPPAGAPTSPVSHRKSTKLFRALWPKVVRQFDEIDCGPAALLTILRYYGGDSTLSKVRDLAGTDADGTSLLGLATAARKLGLCCEGARGELAELEQEQLPCVAHLRLPNGTEHYVVVFKVSAKSLRLGDPASGLRRVSRAEFAKLWASKAVLLVRPTTTLAVAHSLTPFRWLRLNFAGSEVWLLQSVFAGGIYAALGAATSFCIQILVDRMIPAHDVGRVISLGGALVVLTVARSGIGLLRQRFLLETYRRVNSQVAQRFLGRLFRLPLRFFDTRTKGDVAARLHDTSKIQTAMTRVLGASVTDVLIIAGALAYIGFFAQPLFAVAFGSMLVYTALTAIVIRPMKDQQSSAMLSYAELEGTYMDSLNGIVEIRSYGVSQLFERLTLQLFKIAQDRIKAFGMSQARLFMAAEFVGGLVVLSALIYGAVLVSAEHMKLGQMIAAYSLLASSVVPLTRLVDAHISIQGASLAVTRMTDLGEAEEENSDGTKVFTLQRSVEVRNVRFAWSRGEVLFNDLSLSIPKGRITGMWGVSGSGKSTLVRLLQRLYSPVEGQILIDGQSCNEFDLKSYRGGIAVVNAATKVFNMSLFENIYLGRDDVLDKSSLLAVIKEAGLRGFIERFPQGLSTRVGEKGRTLSSGERQAVGLFRAMVGRPSLLIVDEGINALDADIARLATAAIRDYARANAVLLISHDVYTLAETDFVYVLERGRIREEGSVDFLLSVETEFRRLWDAREKPLTRLRHQTNVGNQRNTDFASSVV